MDDNVYITAYAFPDLTRMRVLQRDKEYNLIRCKLIKSPNKIILKTTLEEYRMERCIKAFCLTCKQYTKRHASCLDLSGSILFCSHCV